MDTTGDRLKWPHALRSIAGQHLLIPVTNSGIASYFFLNKTSANIYELICKDIHLTDIQNGYKKAYPNTSPEVIDRDISQAYGELMSILSRQQSVETFSKDAEESFRALATEQRIPIEGSIELTFKCNIKCSHCYCVHCDWKDVELSTTEWLGHIDAMADNGCVWLLISGGEPLMRKDFKQIYTHAKRKGMLVTLFTNGLLVDEDYCKLFAKHPPHWLEISMYGISNDTYQRVTGNRKGFSQLVAALNSLDEYGITYALKTTVVNENHLELKRMMDFAESRKAAFRYDANILPRLDGVSVPKETPISPGEVVAAEFHDDPGRTVSAWVNTKEERANYYKDGLFFCSAGKIMFNIDPFGKMSVCGRVREPSISLRASSFKSAWSALSNFAAQPIPAEFKCNSCAIIQYCKTCPVTRNLSLEDLDSQFCRYTRIRAGIIRSHVSK
jgi:MoaA/NifB/PqqE/SkfB family radical SAM enzyme